MLLDISRALRSPGEEIFFEHRDAIPPQDIFGEEITFTDVILKGHYSMVGESLHLDGVLTCTAHGLCAGCLQPVEHLLEVDFDEIFTRISPYPVENVPEDEDDERLQFEGSKVDLAHLALTLAVLEMPMRLTCKGGCEVLSDMQPDEQITHACQKDVPDQHPFSALQQLLTKDQEV